MEYGRIEREPVRISTLDEALAAVDALRHFVRQLPPDDPSALDEIMDGVDALATDATDYIGRVEARAGEVSSATEFVSDEAAIDTSVVVAKHRPSGPTPCKMPAQRTLPVSTPAAPDVQLDETTDDAAMPRYEELPSPDEILERITPHLEYEPLMTRQLMEAITGRSERSPLFSSIKRMIEELRKNGKLVCSERNHPRWWGLPGKSDEYYACFGWGGVSHEPDDREGGIVPPEDPIQETLKYVREIEARGASGRRRSRR